MLSCEKEREVLHGIYILCGKILMSNLELETYIVFCKGL